LIYSKKKKINEFLFRKENRFDILIYECMFLGFLIGFISFYHHITYILLCFLFIHIIGTLYSEKGIEKIKTIITIFRNIIRHDSSSKVVITKKLPDEYLYKYHLKSTNDLRFEQV
jgi:hypothetical protein